MTITQANTQTWRVTLERDEDLGRETMVLDGFSSYVAVKKHLAKLARQGWLTKYPEREMPAYLESLLMDYFDFGWLIERV